MGLHLYYTSPSAPCRTVLLTARVLNVHLNLHPIDLSENDHLKPDFIKLNPQHVVPTLVDEQGFVVWESRAIQIYLFERFADEEHANLYPTDPQRRALIHQRLFFDFGTLGHPMREYLAQVFTHAPMRRETREKVEQAFELLETFLRGRKWVAGEEMTLADISLLATVSTYEVGKFEVKKYENVKRWLDKCKRTVPGYELNQAGLDVLRKFL